MYSFRHEKIEHWHVNQDWTLFLCRDGVINRKLGSCITSWEMFSFLPGVLDSFHILSDFFQKICIVTNQQGIDEQLLTHDMLHHIHGKMLEIIEFYEGRIDQIYYEPSLAAFNSHRRKPNPGMFYDAKKDFPEINFRKSIMIGNSLIDLQAGQAAKMKTIHICRSERHKLPNKIIENSNMIIGGLPDFCGLIKEQTN